MNIITPLQSTQFAGTGGIRPGQQIQAAMQLQAGQLLNAQVIEVRANSHFLLQIGEAQLLARSDVGLKAGQSLQLQLVAASPQLELKIVNDSLNQHFGRSLTMVGNTIDVSSLLGLMQQPSSILESLSLHSRQTLESFFSLQQNTLAGSEGGTTLKQLIDRLGLSLENILTRGDSDKANTTLKSALLEIIHSFRNADTIHESAGRLLSTLEFFQLAQLHTTSNQQFIFPLPLPFIEQGYLLIDKRNDGEGGNDKNSYSDQDYRFSLHVKMTDIGNISIDFFHCADGLFIRFHTDSQEKADFVAGFSEELKKMISDSPLLGLSFAADAVEPAAELIRLIVPEGTSVLDTTA